LREIGRGGDAHQPATRSGASATSSISQPPMLEPTSTTGPHLRRDQRQHLLAPAAGRAIGKIARRLPASAVIEQQAGAALRHRPIEQGGALEPPCPTYSRAGKPASARAGREAVGDAAAIGQGRKVLMRGFCAAAGDPSRKKSARNRQLSKAPRPAKGLAHV
jgi:hypothetical protein